MTDLSPSSYQPNRSLAAKINRRMTQWRAASPLASAPKRAIVTFTFDDFPISAADTGADIIESFGGRAGYYACTGLSGQSNATGELFRDTHLHALVKAGHEIGAHTHNHLDCSRASPKDAVEDIDLNLQRLKAMGHTEPVRQFAYPYGETRTGLKRKLVGKFDSVRGILPGVNGAGSDAMQLRALEFEPDEATTARAAAAIQAAATTPSWVIIFTHDVSSTPSPFGTTPTALRSLAKQARDSGAAILTPSAAFSELSSPL